MREYMIMTDSCADLTAAEIQELGIFVLPLTYTLDGVTYVNNPDHSELDPEEFYRRLRAGSSCTTAAVNVGQFTEAMTPFLEQGKDILCIVFSSALSTTYQSACIAAEDLRAAHPEAKIIVVDSFAASRGQGLLVYHAVQESRKGRTIEEVAEFVEKTAPHLCHWFTVDDLNHLKRGGRVSAATALVGTALGIKPVLHVDNEGHLINVSKTRGRRASLDALVQHMADTAIDPENQTVFISHGDCLEDAKYVERQIREKLGTKKFYINFIGPVIGAHSGPGTVALFFLGSRR